jgi:hypothetical protein
MATKSRDVHLTPIELKELKLAEDALNSAKRAMQHNQSIVRRLKDVARKRAGKRGTTDAR